MKRVSKKMVSFRFDPKTIKLLERAQKHGPEKGRPITWLVEWAINEQYKDIETQGNNG